MLHSPLKCHGHSDDFTEEVFQNIKEKKKTTIEPKERKNAITVTKTCPNSFTNGN